MNNKQLISMYLAQRFPLTKFLAFAFLLTLLGYWPQQGIGDFAFNFSFVYTSLLVFRATDDAWSCVLDRKFHPNRRYLWPAHFPQFIRLVTALFGVYALLLIAFFPAAGLYVVLLYVCSTAAYFFYHKQRVIMQFIPLLKYPVLVYCISQHQAQQTVRLAIASFVLLFLHDFLEQYAKHISFRPVQVLGFSLLSWLVVPAYTADMSLFLYVLCLVFPFGFLAMGRVGRWPVLPVVLFPVLHVVYAFVL